MRTAPGTIDVLHVDDAPNVAETTATVLESEDERLAVETATSAEAGLERLSTGTIDCVVSGYEMPGRNGIEFLNAVRDEYPELPFILFTGKGSEEIASEAISAGVTDYLQNDRGTSQYAILANRITNAVAEYDARRLERLTSHDQMAILDRIDDGVFALDDDWRVVYVNERATTLFGAPADELRGSPLWEVFSEAADTPFYDHYREAKETNEPKTIEEYFEPWDRWYREHIYPSENGLTILFHDITDQKQRKRRYRAVFENTYQFTGLLDPDGTLVEANETALEFGGLERESIVGKKLWEVAWFQHSKDTRERVQEAVERAANGEFVRNRLPIQGADREAIIDFSVRPLTDERGTVTLLIPEGRDITELVERERALQRERDRLDEFASVVSHDLRNPLNVATGRLELARAEDDNEHLDEIETALDRIDRITEDVLWLAREGRDIGSRDAVRLGDAVDAAWKLVADGNARAELRYGEEIASATVEADDDRFQQLLENLFRNAIEHGGEDVTVTVGSTDRGFYVEDDGPGVPEHHRENVFDGGYSTSEGGTGFGLRIVDRVADAHGWEVRLADGTNGARFEIMCELDSVRPVRS
ncbi:PAS domain-containing protein [Natronococcus occultus]|uniref:histidine kinase n=1 Tax=Natronococcus occultus SP4 TaxID=694430 RepID=L0K2D2_9EURY|nr:PAS domain-containing protein [Natronococcus occultus]AGB38710.1 PAS domain S-box [Natronococcus occultus SP4]